MKLDNITLLELTFPMARPLGIEYEGAVYHIITRGNRGEHIFDRGEDKKAFLDLLGRAVERYGVEVYTLVHQARQVGKQVGNAVAQHAKLFLKSQRAVSGNRLR